MTVPCYFKYRFYPDDEQQQMLARTFGCTRYVYNRALQMCSDAYQGERKTLRYSDTAKALAAWKKEPETAWLGEVSSVPLQQALRHLSRAYAGFFSGKAGFPRFKAKRSKQAASYMANAFSLKDSGTKGQPLVQLAKMTRPLKIRWSRPLPSRPASLSVTKDRAGRYFISFRVEQEIDPLPVTTKSVGIDLGIENIVVTSDGERLGNPRFLQRDLARLGREQRRLARKQPGSNNWEKQRRKVAKVYARIADRRRDFLHKLSTKLIRENDVICLETLRVRNMLKNRRLARAISDVSWSEFVQQLTYKAAWHGRDLVRVGTFFPSSKRCSTCGHVRGSLPLGVRAWVCEECRSAHDRDVNAARNILAVGTTVGTNNRSYASGGRVRPGAAIAASGVAR